MIDINQPVGERTPVVPTCARLHSGGLDLTQGARLETCHLLQTDLKGALSLMSHVPHELSEDFPEHKGRIHELKSRDSHFAKLFDSYHEINRAIHRAETDIEPVDDATMQTMRKERMDLKDRIYAMLTSAG